VYTGGWNGNDVISIETGTSGGFLTAAAAQEGGVAYVEQVQLFSMDFTLTEDVDFTFSYAISGTGVEEAMVISLFEVGGETAYGGYVSSPGGAAADTVIGSLLAGDYAIVTGVRSVAGGIGPFDSSAENCIEFTFKVRPASAGDLNCDGVLDLFDIDPFVMALTDESGYAEAYPDCDRDLADINNDGTADLFDIDPFVQLLTQ